MVQGLGFNMNVSELRCIIYNGGAKLITSFWLTCSNYPASCKWPNTESQGVIHWHCGLAARAQLATFRLRMLWLTYSWKKKDHKSKQETLIGYRKKKCKTKYSVTEPLTYNSSSILLSFNQKFNQQFTVRSPDGTVESTLRRHKLRNWNMIL